MSSEEDENYVTVTVKARGREHSLYCRTAVVVTAGADNIPGPACHIGDLDRDALPVLADRAVSELAAKLGVDPNTAKGFILLPALEDDIAAAAEEAYCVDFGARDEIARIAEDLGVDADI